MSESDWSVLTDSLDVTVVDRGVTSGVARPNGGGTFLYGFNSLSVASGGVGLFANQANFAPMSKGMSIRGALKRGVSGGPTNFSVFLMAGVQGTSVNDQAYMLGLADDDPYHIVLKKGVIANGVDDLAPDAPSNGVLLRSNDTFAQDTWHHLRLDMIVNTNGDVVLKCFESDLDANTVGSPVWTAIDGMEEFIDDALQINSGSPAFTSGRGGYGYATTDVTRRGYIDHMEVIRQL